MSEKTLPPPRQAKPKGGQQQQNQQQKASGAKIWSSKKRGYLTEEDIRQIRGFINELSRRFNDRAYRQRLARYFPAHMRTEANVETLKNSIITTLRSQPDSALDADMDSLFLAACKVAAKGLWVGDNICHLVPYKGQFEMQLGYRGMILLVRRAKLPIFITAGELYANDTALIVEGSAGKCEITPYTKGPRGDFLGAWACVKYIDWNMVDPEWMGKDQIDDIRAMSPSKGSPAWENHYAQMGVAKVIKRLCKRLPFGGIDLSDMDDAYDAEGRQLTIEGAADGVDQKVENIILDGEEGLDTVLAIQAPTEQAIDMTATSMPDEQEKVIVNREESKPVEDGEFAFGD